MRKFIVKYLWLFVLFLAIALLVLYTLALPEIKIDSISIVLLVIIIISPLISQIKKIRYGNFEAEIGTKEVQKVVKEVEENLADLPDETESTISNKSIENINSIFNTDHVLALAKLRMELEKRINILISFNKNSQNSDKGRNVSLSKRIYELTIGEVLTKDTSNYLREIIYFCNRAIHGEDVKKNDAKMIIDSGLRVFNEINMIIKEYNSSKTKSKEISAEDIDGFRNSKYELVTVIPYTDKPIKNTRILSQEELDSFFDGYSEFAEFIVKLTKISI